MNTTSERLLREIPSPRETAAWRAVETAVGQRTAHATDITERLKAAQQVRRNAESELLRLQGERCGPDVIANACRDVILATAAERGAQHAFTTLAAPDSELVQQEREQIQRELGRCAAAIIKRNVPIGERLVKQVEALLETAGELQALNALERSYFDGLTPHGEPILGCMAYLPQGTRSYPGLTPDTTLREFGAWLVRVREHLERIAAAA